jgi:hypothetical protein
MTYNVTIAGASAATKGINFLLIIRKSFQVKKGAHGDAPAALLRDGIPNEYSYQAGKDDLHPGVIALNQHSGAGNDSDDSRPKSFRFHQ